MQDATDNPGSVERRKLGLALIGYGKMGRTIASLAPDRGFDVRLTLDIDTNAGGAAITKEQFKGIDVALDFTMPTSVVDNVRKVAATGTPLVVGTTGWFDRLDEVRKIVEQSGIGMVYAPNFSIGVYLFYKIARAAAEAFAPFQIYDPYITEAHHRTKKDAPSGTALELKRNVEAAMHGRPVAVSSLRAGSIPGTHELGFDSEADTVIVRHTARSRRGLAEGSLVAARWIVGKKGLFSFADVLDQRAGG